MADDAEAWSWFVPGMRLPLEGTLVEKLRKIEALPPALVVRHPGMQPVRLHTWSTPAAPEMWNLVRDALRPLRRPDCIVLCLEGIDLMHALGHLSDALIALGDDEAKRQRQLDEWHDQLLARDSAIETIEGELLARLPTTSGAERTALDKELTFVNNNKDRMRYANLARRGLPLGSGVTESAAKTVINQRAKGAGQRWKETGLRHVLAVRSIVQSERLPAFWGHFSRLYAANVMCAPTPRRDAA